MIAKGGQIYDAVLRQLSIKGGQIYDADFF